MISGQALSLRVHGDTTSLTFSPEALVIAGFTGRDQDAVRHHIDELLEHGIPPPEEVPAFYVVPRELLTTTEEIEVSGTQTSGEAEPVLLCTDNQWFVGVGSDHTARDLERVDILQSKKACQKVISREVFPYDSVAEHWDTMVLRSWVGAEERPYQEGSLAELMPIPELLLHLRKTLGKEPDNLAIFLGTVPLRTRGFVFGDRYTVELSDRAEGTAVRATYAVTQRRKPK